MNSTDNRTVEGYVRPRRLTPGETVAVVAPASPLKRGQRAVVERSLDVLASWGLEHQAAPGVRARRGFLAGSNGSRLAQLRWAFLNEEIRGILCLRGGYGAMRLLHDLEPEILRDHPKVLVGFSDLTVLLLHLLQAGGVVAFHGPTLTSAGLADGPNSPTARSLYRAVMEAGVPESIPGEVWAGGMAEGPLVGGCLSMLTAVMGTPFAPRLDNAILFVEDVNEPLYRIDRMLCQLRLSGLLDGVRGIAVGEMIGTIKDGRTDELRTVFLDAVGPLNIPVIFGVPSGHGRVNLTLPLGCRVHLDGKSGALTFLEAGVR